MIVPLDQHDVRTRPRRGDRGRDAGRARLSLSRSERNTSAWKNSRT